MMLFANAVADHVEKVAVEFKCLKSRKYFEYLILVNIVALSKNLVLLGNTLAFFSDILNFFFDQKHLHCGCCFRFAFIVIDLSHCPIVCRPNTPFQCVYLSVGFPLFTVVLLSYYCW